MKETLPPSTLRTLRGHRLRALSGGRDGVALLVVLAFIILLSILVASFLSFSGLDRLSTASYSKSIQAQEVAQGGLQDIIADLHQEIVAGSQSGANFTQGSTTVYVPTTNYTAQPARLGFAANDWTNDIDATRFAPTLVRVSRASSDGTATDFVPPLNTAYYTGGPLNRASASSSATPSVNGRYISPTVWNKPGLLAAPGQPIPSDFVAPDWVYVTRAGSGAFSSINGLKPSTTLNTVPTPTAGQPLPASPVTGRYAYVIYDEGALLDANVAGYPFTESNNPPSTYTPNSTSSGLASQEVRGKSYVTYADLTQLPGFTGNQASVTSFVNWRDAGGLAYAAGNGTGTSFLGAVFNYAQNGFLQFVSSGAASDSPLLNRQDLLNYFAKIDPTNSGAAKALPYLGTYSRAVSAPSWTPRNSQNPFGAAASIHNAPTTNYASQAETTGVANRDMANVRYTVPGTVTHYLDNATTTNPDGTTSSYSVAVGDPLLQNRFSLARIGWLSSSDIGGMDAPGTTNPNTGNGPSAQFATAIQACFGLKWGIQGVANGGNACWAYVGSSGGTTPIGTIETLDQVAAESREPNFFELLKAAILSGSLGMSAGPAAFNNGTSVAPYSPHDYHGNFSSSTLNDQGSDNKYSYSFDLAQTTKSPYRIPDIQIMKIGADIIDQYDADSYPTAIYFPYPAVGNYDAKLSGTSPPNDMFGSTDMVFGDENIPSLYSMTVVSGVIEGTQSGTFGCWWQPELWNCHQMNSSSQTTASTPSNFTIKGYGSIIQAQLLPGGYISAGLTGNYINFTDSSPTTSAFFASPLLLNVSGINGVTVTGTSNDAAMRNKTSMQDYATNPFVGFSMGTMSSWPPSPISSSAGVETQSIGPASFSLGWLDSRSGFHPYSWIAGIFAYCYSTIYNLPRGAPEGDAGSADPGKDAPEAHHLFDPRTARFGTTSEWGFPDDFSKYSSIANAHPSDIPSTSGAADTYGWGDPAGKSDNPSASSFVYRIGQFGRYPVDWEVNAANIAIATGATATYYLDPDGIVRPGDAVFGNDSTGDGMPLYTAAGAGAPTGTSYPTSDMGGNEKHGRRPIILNRPFRSVGELGYAFRDLPFKTLDFYSPVSADAGLLDVFSLTDESKVTSKLGSTVAGEVNLSNSPVPILTSILIGGCKKEAESTYNLSATDATAVAQNIVNFLNPAGISPNPLLSRADLATQLWIPATASYLYPTSIITSAFPAVASDSSDQCNKAYFEGPVRALSNVANTRTWNLMVDIIAQSGHLSSTATSLDNFAVEGERRYWLHLAIDRYTGKVVSQQLEPVYE